MCLHEFVKLVTRETTLLDNNHSEPKALVRLFRFPEQNYNFSKRRIIKNILPHTNARMRANAFHEKTIADLKVEEYKNTLQEYWWSSTPDFTICRSKSMICILCKFKSI